MSQNIGKTSSVLPPPSTGQSGWTISAASGGLITHNNFVHRHSVFLLTNQNLIHLYKETGFVCQDVGYTKKMPVLAPEASEKGLAINTGMDISQGTVFNQESI